MKFDYKSILVLWFVVFSTNCSKNSSNNSGSSAAAAALLLGNKPATSNAIITTLEVTGLNKPEDIEVDSFGVIYVTDSKNNKIKKIANEKDVTVIADTNIGTETEINNPEGICLGNNGDVFVANTGNSASPFKGHNIIKITSTGVVSRYAGPNGSSSDRKTVDGTLASAYFNKPEGIYFDIKSSALYVGEANGNTVRKVTDSSVTTFAGSTSNTSGYLNAIGTSSLFKTVKGLVTDSSGNIYVADSGNNAIRKITTEGLVSTFAGSTVGEAGSQDGKGNSARFSAPYGMTIDKDGNLYVVDGGNHTIRKITSDGTVTTVVGIAGKNGSDDGTASIATLDAPRGVSIYEKNGIKILYVSTTGGTTTTDGLSTTGSKIRKVVNF